MVPIESSAVTICRRRRLGVPGRDGVCTVVSLAGEHDVSTVATLSAALARAIMLDDNDVVVDLSRVGFMGAATVSVIFRGREILGAQARRLVLRSPSTRARRVLELCDDEDLLALADATPMTCSAGAIGTRAPVPATDRADRPVGASPSIPTGCVGPVSASPGTAATEPSVEPV